MGSCVINRLLLSKKTEEVLDRPRPHILWFGLGVEFHQRYQGLLSQVELRLSGQLHYQPIAVAHKTEEVLNRPRTHMKWFGLGVEFHYQQGFGCI